MKEDHCGILGVCTIGNMDLIQPTKLARKFWQLLVLKWLQLLHLGKSGAMEGEGGDWRTCPPKVGKNGQRKLA